MTRFISMCLALCMCAIISQQASAKQYTFRDGDTISGILAKSAPTLAELERANPNKKNWPDVQTGEVLEIPALSSAEAQALESQNAELKAKVGGLEQSVTSLTLELDRTRAESGEWQSKYTVAEPLAASAAWGRTLNLSFLGILLALAIVFSLMCVKVPDMRMRFKERIRVLEEKNKELEGDPESWRRIRAMVQGYLAALGQLKPKDRAELLYLFESIQRLSSDKASVAVMDYVAERARVTPRVISIQSAGKK
jgi:LysM repeat protein